ncbi:LOW QUALITY PROTEIN: small ribosomal subunit protein mS39 [Aulostomus maculatus]
MVSLSQKPLASNMAAAVRHVGQHILRNNRVLLANFEQSWGHRKFGWTSALLQRAAEANTGVEDCTEQIVIPRKKEWSKEAVLEALASTVGKDSTAHPYQFRDDPYLSPRNPNESKLYFVSQESGRSVAKHFINSHPQFFTKDFAEPHIPCLMPEAVSPSLEELSEAALKELINFRKVSAAVDMYDRLLQADIAISMETAHDLLDLICFYGDKDPIQEVVLQTEYKLEDPERNIKVKQDENKLEVGSSWVKTTWRVNNNAERILSLLPERDTRCFSALIRGMVKHGAAAQAYNMYIDMLNNKVKGDVHIFNALFSASASIKNTFQQRWDFVRGLLVEMKQQKIQPNLQTFNNILAAMKGNAYLGTKEALYILNEMKAIGIEPSLASYNSFLAIFYRGGYMDVDRLKTLKSIISELEGTHLTCQDPSDTLFFLSAIKLCLKFNDLELGYKVIKLVQVGENRKLLGDFYRRNLFYRQFFKLLCQMENIDQVLKWYKELYPSLFFPASYEMLDLLQALDTDSRLDLVPAIWEDTYLMHPGISIDVVNKVLLLMARDKQSPEVQESFAVCALKVKELFDPVKGSLSWSTPAVSHITTLLLRANKTQQAWEMLQIFKEGNRIPSEELMEEFLLVCRSEKTPTRAVELVQLSAAFCLEATPRLAKQVLAEFDLNEEQRTVLSQLETAGEPPVSRRCKNPPSHQDLS